MMGLIGRDTVLSALRDLALSARDAGDLRVAALTGEAGMGKSTVLDAFTAELPPFAVLRGECLDLGAARLPYAPVIQALRPVLRDPAGRGLALSAPARAALGRLLPELHGGGSRDDPTESPDPDIGQTQLFGHLLGVLEQAARPHDPLVVVVEDVHVCDPATADLLTFLIGNLVGVPLLVLLSARADEIGRSHPARPLLASLARSPRGSMLELPPLGPADLARLVGADRAESLEAVLRRSGGNPLFALELAASGGGLGALTDLLLARVERCDQPTQRVLQVLAVAGADVDHDALLAVSGLPEPLLLGCLRQAVDARLVVIGPEGGHRLSHDLIADVVEESLLPGESRALHAAMGAELAREGGNVGPCAGRLARHHRAAGRPAEELEAAHAAARRAQRMLAHRDAADLYERVAQLWPSTPDAAARTSSDLAAVLADAADSALAAYDHRRAIVLAERALAALDASAPPERAALLHMRIGEASIDDGPRAVAALRTARAALPPGQSAARARVEAALARALHDEEHHHEAEELAVKSAALAERLDLTLVRIHALRTLSGIKAERGAADPDLAAEVAALARAAGRMDVAVDAASGHVAALGIAGRLGEAAEVAAAAVALAEAHGLDRTVGGRLRCNQAMALELLGRFDEARATLETALPFAPPGLLRVDLLHNLISLLTKVGDLDAAAAYAERERAEMGAITRPLYTVSSAVVRAELHLARDEPAVAVEVLKRVAGDARTIAFLAFEMRILLLEAALVGVDDDAIRPLVASLGDTSEADAPLFSVTDAHVGALLATIDDDPDAVSRWEAVRQGYAAHGRPYAEVSCLLRLAELHLARGARRDARTAVSEAVERSAALGARLLHTRAVELARRVGTSPEDRRGDPRLGLTARECEVLQLVAEGLSNGQIGQQLFISTKTASVHVSNILAKLGVTSRTAAAAMAHREGVVT